MNKDLYVSYQMGKVASSAIVDAIPDCMQFHSWSAELPVKFFSSRNTGSLLGVLKQRWKWQRDFRLLNKRVESAKKSNARIKLIIGVREPVSRNISGYFQSLMGREKGVDIEECMNQFHAFCPHLAPLYWFDVELKKHFGIDVYDYPFDNYLGFGVFSCNDVDIFIYQQEKLKHLQSELSEFVGFDVSLKKVNDGGDKWSSDLYKKFLETYDPSSEYLELMYSSKYFEHFYGDEMKSVLLSKWRSKK